MAFRRATGESWKWVTPTAWTTSIKQTIPQLFTVKWTKRTIGELKENLPLVAQLGTAIPKTIQDGNRAWNVYTVISNRKRVHGPWFGALFSSITWRQVPHDNTIWVDKELPLTSQDLNEYWLAQQNINRLWPLAVPVLFGPVAGAVALPLWLSNKGWLPTHATVKSDNVYDHVIEAHRLIVDDYRFKYALHIEKVLNHWYFNWTQVGREYYSAFSHIFDAHWTDAARDVRRIPELLPLFKHDLYGMTNDNICVISQFLGLPWRFSRHDHRCFAVHRHYESIVQDDWLIIRDKGQGDLLKALSALDDKELLAACLRRALTFVDEAAHRETLEKRLADWWYLTTYPQRIPTMLLLAWQIGFFLDSKTGRSDDPDYKHPPSFFPEQVAEVSPTNENFGLVKAIGALHKPSTDFTPARPEIIQETGKDWSVPFVRAHK